MERSGDTSVPTDVGVRKGDNCSMLFALRAHGDKSVPAPSDSGASDNSSVSTATRFLFVRLLHGRHAAREFRHGRAWTARGRYGRSSAWKRCGFCNKRFGIHTKRCGKRQKWCGVSILDFGFDSAFLNVNSAFCFALTNVRACARDLSASDHVRCAERSECLH